jgi:hypothetical protein
MTLYDHMGDKTHLEHSIRIQNCIPLLPAGTVWPYRLVTKVFAALSERYPGRLTIETEPIGAMNYSPCS